MSNLNQIDWFDPFEVEGYPYQPVPLLVSSLQDVCIVQIACGDAHTVALSREGLLYSWGGGGCGQLGHSETSKMPKDEDGCPYQLTPRVVEHLRPHVVSSVACGKAHTIAVSQRGRMFTWGAGACGQLGHPDTSSFPSDEDGYPFQPVPREVDHLKDFKDGGGMKRRWKPTGRQWPAGKRRRCEDERIVSWVHTLALTDDGYVYSFGGGSYGQLGVKDVLAMPVDADNCPYMPTPQLVFGLEGIVRLACGDSHSLTIDRDGRLYCWGANSCGQLGIMNPDDPRIRKDPDGIPHLPTPAIVEALADQRIVDIACGEAHSLAVSATGNLYSWGACSCGQLGLGSVGPRNIVSHRCSMNDAAGPPKTSANFVALTPLYFLERAAEVFPDRLAIIHGPVRTKRGGSGRTWSEVYARSRQLCSALKKRGIGRGDVVSVLLNNSPEHIEAHFGIPMTGAVLNPLNYRLDSRTLNFMLSHAEGKILIVDREYSKLVKGVLEAWPPEKRPFVVDVDDPQCKENGPLIGAMNYEQLLAEGDPLAPWEPPADEWDTLSLCYTSGTTADPKGVLLHHRGAYLKSVHLIVKWPLHRHSVYLWTVPIFHLNGWFFPYAVAAVAGVNVCLRKVVANDIFAAVKEHKVTHICGAPIVMSTMLQYSGSKNWDQELKFMTSAAAPPAPVLARMADYGIEVSALGWGMASLEWKDEWNAKTLDEKAALLARQGVRCLELEYLEVIDPTTRKPVPRDGQTIGEIVMSGNTIMKGYFKNPEATAKEFKGGVFNTGDLGVRYPDGYIQLKDRSKDIIISGGENISSLEVESIMMKHEKIAEVAVVARPDEKWGETPVAWIVCRDGQTLTDEACGCSAPELM
ncbi:Acetate/butyrate--CoA ligase AAE7, partial [Durusdinium trenchii]